TDVTSELAALEGELVRLKARVEELRLQGADAAPLEDQIRSLERKREDLLHATVAIWLTETGTAPR
ncbi:MAG: hypothetical protein H5T97_04210, partial [Firmicutes bacterium]|nr:hypothetical protein [Bacillota bacterium]